MRTGFGTATSIYSGTMSGLCGTLMTTTIGATSGATTLGSTIPSTKDRFSSQLSPLLAEQNLRHWEEWCRRVQVANWVRRCARAARTINAVAATALLLCFAEAELQAADEAPRVVDRLIESVGKRPEAEVWELRDQVQRGGSEAVRQVAMRWPGVDDRVRGELAHAIGRIPGQDASDLLLRISLDSTNRHVASIGLFYLAERAEAGKAVIRYGPEDWARILGWVRRGDQHDAAVWAYVASGFSGAPQDELADAMIEGLRRRFATPTTEEGEPGYISYMSPAVSWNSVFIRAAIRVESGPMLQRLRFASAGSKDEKERMWLGIARGRCGDPEVKDEVLRLVEDGALEPSLRAEALRAYVGAAGQEAVPVLLKYRDDTTREPSWLAAPPLGTVARSQLSRLRARAESSQ